MVLSEGEVATFARRGFLVLKGLFSSDSVKRVSDWLERMQRIEGGQEAKYYEKSPDSGKKLLVRAEYVLGEHNSEMTELLLDDKVTSILTQLFGESPQLFKEKVNFKLPGCRPDLLHQDQAAGWNRYADLFITMALVVDANRRENAALTFLSSGNYPKALMGPEWEPLTREGPPYEPTEEYSLIEADPGDVIFFDSYVPHGSPSNNSDKARRNLFLTFNRRSDGDMREEYYREKWLNYPPNGIDEARDISSYRV